MTLMQQAAAFYKEGRYKEALKCIAQAEAERPLSQEGLFSKALCLYKLGKSEEALHLCDTLPANEPRVVKLRQAIKETEEEEKPTISPMKVAAYAVGFVALILIVIGVLNFQLYTSIFVDRVATGASRLHTIALPMGELPYMDQDPIPLEKQAFPTVYGQSVLHYYAKRGIPESFEKNRSGTHRILMAKLAVKQDIDAVNSFLRSQQPFGPSGSSWEFLGIKHEGDYDFTEVGLTSLLYLFGEDPAVLYPATVDHIVNVLLIEKGLEPRLEVPGSYGFVIDTENHHLMTEGSRYLRNQWLYTHGHEEAKYNNDGSELESWFIEYLQEIIDEGVYEFNSNPYIEYTLHGLLNLAAFPANEEIRKRAQYILDIMNYQFALGSSNLRRFVSFRRRMDHAEDSTLYGSAHYKFMQVWTSPPYSPENALLPGRFPTESVLAEALPYRLPHDLKAWTLEKPKEYFVKIGRGPEASPEIHSGGPGFLLSAGGVHRGPRSMISARATILLLDDDVDDIIGTFNIPGKGEWREWHNTGVYKRFACGNAPVFASSRYGAKAKQNGWAIYAPEVTPTLRIATYSDETIGFGLIALFPEESRTPKEILEALINANPDTAALPHRFQWPQGDSIEYDVNAPKGTWVIQAVNGQAVDRDYDHWPHVTGTPPALSFDNRIP